MKVTFGRLAGHLTPVPLPPASASGGLHSPVSFAACSPEGEGVCEVPGGNPCAVTIGAGSRVGLVFYSC